MENRHANILEFRQTARPSRRNFAYPHQLVTDPGIDPEEKRAILSAWASDAHAVPSLPALRHLPGTPRPVTFSSIMNALAALDRMTRQDDDDPPPPLSPGGAARPPAPDRGDRRKVQWSFRRPKAPAFAVRKAERMLPAN